MSKNIKVLHIISSLGQGGAERQLVEIVKKNKNHAICQLISGGEFEEEINKENIAIFDLKIKKSFLDFLCLYRLNKIIKNFKPDIIHTWMYHSSLLETILRKITFYRHIPLVWGIRCSNMDTSQYSKSLKLVINCCKYFSNTPDFIINNSKSGLEYHKKLGFKKTNIVISNGINTKKFIFDKELRDNFRNMYNIPENIKVLLCVARYDPMKDHQTLLESFVKVKKIYPSIILILAGIGTENIEKVDGILTLGACKNINNIYSASDIIISSSAFGEGFSNALAEGMASSLVPIATNVGDSENIIGRVGKLIEPKNKEELYLAIRELIELEDKYFLEKRKLARRRIEENFSQSKMFLEYENIYNKLLEK